MRVVHVLFLVVALVLPQVAAASVSAFGAELPIGAGSYRLDTRTLGAFGTPSGTGPGDFRIADDRIEIEVAAVRLPASVGLLAGAMAPLGALRLRRRA